VPAVQSRPQRRWLQCRLSLAPHPRPCAGGPEPRPPAQKPLQRQCTRRGARGAVQQPAARGEQRSGTAAGLRHSKRPPCAPGPVHRHRARQHAAAARPGKGAPAVLMTSARAGGTVSDARAYAFAPNTLFWIAVCID
jgi:hypothetical protein